MNQKHKAKFGFSLIEILIVIGIIGILAAIAAISYNRSRIQSRDARRMADTREIFNSLQLYYTNTEEFPPDCSDPGYSGACDINDQPIAGVNSDSSEDRDFVTFLTPDFLGTVPLDPTNDADHSYLYSTFVEFPAGSGEIYSFMVTSRLEDDSNRQGGIATPPGMENYFILGERYE
jgi:prepilin-type N-terminal cleavage/methylation domain-containing protein